MLDIGRYLNSENIVPELKSSTRDGVISELVDKMLMERKAPLKALGRDSVVSAVIERENMQSTGIGNALAFPHARIEGWGEFSVAMGIHRNGVDFSSIDRMPAKFIFLMISSPEEPYIILQTMASIIRFLSDMGFGEDMLDNPFSAAEILRRFKKADFQHPNEILAGDIAQPVAAVLTLDTSVEEATKMMHLNHLDILPVVDDSGRLKGELSCLDIFEYGMPDFFRQLNTISFVKHIDPFEKYFKIKRDLLVKDMFSSEINSISIGEDKTLLEIIFEMTVHHKSKLFVVDDDMMLKGEIDRFCVIDKILFF